MQQRGAETISAAWSRNAVILFKSVTRIRQCYGHGDYVPTRRVPVGRVPMLRQIS